MRGTIRTSAAEGSRRFISPSELASVGCWRAYRWKRIGLKPITNFAALDYGTAWDAFMGAWWTPVGRPGDGMVDARSADQRLGDSLAAGQAALDREARRVDGVLADRGLPRPMGWHDDLTAMRTMLVGMALHYANTVGVDDGSTVCRASQFKVEVPLPSQSGRRRSGKFWMRGYIDRVMESHETGRLFIVDDKTTGRVSRDYIASFAYDLQLPIYGWAMRQLGYDIERVSVEAAGKLLPAFPELRKTLVPVLGPDGEPLTQPIPCPACNGERGHDELDPDGNLVTVHCAKCDGEGVARFASGARKGEVKTETVKRQALRSMLTEAGGLNYTTTLAAFDSALVMYGLDPADYERERTYLIQQEQYDSPYFATFDLVATDAVLNEAEDILRAAAPELDRIPDIPLRDRFKCQRCVFRVPCLEIDPAARADALHAGFTTREQRDAAQKIIDERNAANAELYPDAPTDAPDPTMDALDAAFAAADTSGFDPEALNVF